ncbi:MAG: isoprenylcysteine carboxylmethyltransferase family protein [Chlamydiota bacterium]|nr:isoprenylcysteine carboxylmethyltransferase family protein [Chlamydiota bacterium]
MKLVNVRPPIIAGLLIAVSVVLHFALPKEYRLDFACRACGIVAFAVGFIVMVWAWWLFRQLGTPALPTNRASSLVTTGPFRFSRNPMYLGIVIMLFAIVLWVGSWPMLIAPVGFFVFMSLVRIPYEEQQLRDIFGEDYTSYTENIRRWI